MSRFTFEPAQAKLLLEQAIADIERNIAFKTTQLAAKRQELKLLQVKLQELESK